MIVSMIKINIAILTISDRAYKKERDDTSGPELVKKVNRVGWNVVKQAVIPDELAQISKTLIDWVDSGEVDLILTTGGTGCSPRDVTPEATSVVIERAVQGLAEAMRAESMRKTPHAMLSRAVAGICKKTLIINLPGSPAGAVENLQVIIPVIPHAVELIRESETAESEHRRLNRKST